MKMNGMMNMKMEFNINYQIINFFFPLKIYLFIYLFCKYKSPNKTTYLKKCAQVLTQKKKKKKVPKFKN